MIRRRGRPGRTSRLVGAVAVLVLASAAAGAETTAPEDGKEFRFGWKDGITLERADGAVKLALSGLIHQDWGVVTASDEIDTHLRSVNTRAGEPPPGPGTGTGTRLRRAWMATSGSFMERVRFKAQLAFQSSGSVSFVDVYVGLINLPGLGNLTLGQFKEPFSLEEMTSAVHLPLLERSLLAAFNPARRTGILANDQAAGGRMTWALGAFRGDAGNASGFGNEGLYDLTGRITFLPWDDPEADTLLHLGAGFSHQFKDHTAVDYAAQPESSLTSRYVDTAYGATQIDDATHVDLANFEIATSIRWFTLQAESSLAHVIQGGAADDLLFWGAYGQVGILLTGEHRPYDHMRGALGAIEPSNPFDPGAGDWGAVQLVARVSHLDLDDRRISGGELTTAGFGVNWHLFENVRVMSNYVVGRLEGIDGLFHAYQMRFQVGF